MGKSPTASRFEKIRSSRSGCLRPWGPLIPVILLGIVLAAIPASAQPRKFTNSAGQELIAEIVSAQGDLVELLMDGKPLTTRIDVFSAADQEYIRKWIKDHPPEIDYHFEVEVDKKKLERNLQDAGYKKFKNDVYTYRVTITNRNRETVKGLKVKYRAFKEDRVDGAYIRSSQEVEMKEGTVDLPELKYNHAASFDTESFVLDEVRYDYTTRTTKDTLEGVLIRIVDAKGNVISDHREGESSIKNRSWEDKDPRAGGDKKAVIVSPLGN